MSSPAYSKLDVRCMQRALELAARGGERTAPNPMVGAVVVREGRIVGEGWHEQAGGPHAEVRALEAAGPSARGAVLYVTLEPCNHYGRTPPCCESIETAGIARVCIASLDPNPAVAGGGAERLKRAGIEVSSGLYTEQEQKLNSAWRANLGPTKKCLAE